MIPKFGDFSGYLPKGEHPATWSELENALGFSPKRKALLAGLLVACRDLRGAGVEFLFIDGSFATRKKIPGDYDCCYISAGVDPSKLDAVFLDFSNERAAMKAKYGGEFFPAEMIASRASWEPYRTFFQRDQNGRKKGIVVLDLKTLP